MILLKASKKIGAFNFDIYKIKLKARCTDSIASIGPQLASLPRFDKNNVKSDTNSDNYEDCFDNQIWCSYPDRYTNCYP